MVKSRHDFHPALRLLVYCVMLLFTLMTIAPLIWMMLSSLKTTAEFQLNRLGWPQNPTLLTTPVLGGWASSAPCS